MLDVFHSASYKFSTYDHSIYNCDYVIHTQQQTRYQSIQFLLQSSRLLYMKLKTVCHTLSNSVAILNLVNRLHSQVNSTPSHRLHLNIKSETFRNTSKKLARKIFELTLTTTKGWSNSAPPTKRKPHDVELFDFENFRSTAILIATFKTRSQLN